MYPPPDDGFEEFCAILSMLVFIGFILWYIL